MNIVVETSFFGNFKQADEPKVLIIPAPYEYTTSFNKGTKNGPQAILNASTQLNTFDDELWTDVTKIGINTSNFVNCEFVSNKSRQPFGELEQAVRNSVISGFLPVVLGGEHALSYGSLKAIYELYPDISILYFDSRLDLKDIHSDNKFHSACTLRRLHEAMPDLKIVVVGARSVADEETEWLETNNPGIEIFFSRDKIRWNITDILSSLTKNVFISFDFSVLDSSVMPSCSMPEPGGLNWAETTDIIKNICAFKEILGIDFCSFSPIPGLLAPDFLAAKLIFKSIAYTHARHLGAFEEEKKPLVTSDEV